jgi:hypothetical protein
MKKLDFSAAEVAAALGAIAENASTPVINLRGQNYGVKDKTVYVSAFISDLQNGEILNPSNTPNVGLRNFDKNQLPEGTYQLVKGVRILSANALSAHTDAALKGASFADTAIAAVYNGELKFSQNQVLAHVSGSDVTCRFAATSNEDTFRAVTPFLLRPQTDTNIVLTTSGATVAGNDAIKLEYRCIELVKLGKA